MIETIARNLRRAGFSGRSLFFEVLMSSALAGILIIAVNLPLSDASALVKIPSPFAVDDRASLEIGTSLELTPDAYPILRSYRNIRLSDFPLSREEKVDLELERFAATTPGTRIVIGTDTGDVPVQHADVALFRGKITQKPNSRVVLSVSPRGSYGIIAIDRDGYVITPQRQAGNSHPGQSHAIQKLSELHRKFPPAKLKCGTKSTPSDLPTISTLPSAELPGSFQVCRLALECDYEFYDRFQDYRLALDYIFVVFAAITEIYERDVSAKLALTFIRIWTTINDPYSSTGGGPPYPLHEFQDYWIAHHSTPGTEGYVFRDLAHLMSGRGVEAAGNISQLCLMYGYSISGGNAGGGNPPSTSLTHDVLYVAHEIGHNFNGAHTHCIKDDFGNWVDKCAVESGCNDTQDCTTAPSSIMSYCDIGCPGGFNNILQQFDAVNITRIRSHIVSSCLPVARNPAYVDWRNNSGVEDGTGSHPYNTVKEGIEIVLPGGVVSMANGSYPEQITIWQPMSLSASGGTVIIGQ